MQASGTDMKSSLEYYIASCKTREVPTVRRVTEAASCGDLRKLHHFQGRRGRVECALDAVLDITEVVMSGGDDARWEYETSEDDIEALTATPLDAMLGLARFMCFDREGGTHDKRAPHMEVIKCGLRLGLVPSPLCELPLSSGAADSCVFDFMFHHLHSESLLLFRMFPHSPSSALAVSNVTCFSRIDVSAALAQVYYPNGCCHCLVSGVFL